MAGRECYHCKQWVEAGEPHDCWTTTEAALTRDLAEDLQDAWQRLRETAAAFGEQRIYASHNSIMFARRSCYLFVRPKPTYLEVCIFLGRTIAAPQIRRVEPASKVKMVHFVRIRHRDEVEPPLTDWLREAYDLQGTVSPASPLPRPAVKALPTTAAPSTARKALGPESGKAKKTSRSKRSRSGASKTSGRR